MIVTQEKELFKSQTQFQALLDFVRQAVAGEVRIDEVEREVFQRLLQVGLTLLKAFVMGHGDGDVGATLPGADDDELRRLPEMHARRYVSIFGELLLQRFVYGSREGQKIERVPLDECLGLPAGEFSYVLEDWGQRLCLKGAFAEAAQSLASLLNLKLSVRSLEHMNRSVAEPAANFRDEQPAPPAAQEGPIVVVTADGKGVPMRRPRAPSQPRRRRPGAKANKKQMAYVGAVYSIDRFVRTPDDVVEEVRRQARTAERPQPRHKRVWAEMTQVIEGETCNGKEALFGQLADEVLARNHGGTKEVVCLLDGERALWRQCQKSYPWAVGILDLFHVLERLWQAGHCLYAEGSPQVERFVTQRLRRVLQGQVGSVVRGLRRLRTQRQVRGSRRGVLTRVIGYLHNNRAHMRYDQYLAAGYPIGSGVAEGACRHLVKDRLEQTGMRWTVEGAQAMLDLRALYLNGDWQNFMAYRIGEEQQRLYRSPAA